MPASSVVTARAARSSDSQRVRRARRRPWRTTRPFHGISSTTANPATPWAITTHRPPVDPDDTAPTPVASASSNATSSARFVRRPAGPRRTLARRPRVDLAGTVMAPTVGAPRGFDQMPNGTPSLRPVGT